MGRLAVALLVALSAFLIARGAPWLDRISGAEARVVFDVTLPPGADGNAIEATWRARLRDDLRDIAPGGTPAQRVVTIACSGTERDCSAKADSLDHPGRFEIREVRENSPAMRALFAAVRGLERSDVTADVDTWRDDRTGETHNDFFLLGVDAFAIVEAIGRVHEGEAPRDWLRADEEIVVETFYRDDGMPLLRTYLVGGPPIVTSEDVVDARVLIDVPIDEPEVLVTLSDAGARRFGDATARLRGHKLAMILDGVVVSAPVIQAAITGGRFTVGQRFPDNVEQLAASEVMAATILGAPLPDGIRTDPGKILPRSEARGWAAIAAFVLLAALLAWAIATWVVRTTTAAPGVIGTARANVLDLAAPLLITAIVIAGLDQLADVFLPWMTQSFRERVAGMGGPDAIRTVSPIALGAIPFVSAYVLVELIAWVVPSLRRRRVGTSAERAPLELAVACVAFGLALVQSYLLLHWLRTVDAPGMPALEDAPFVGGAVVASLVGGVALHAIAAQLITAYGACNGWLAIAAYAALRTLPHDRGVLGLVVLGAVIAIGLTARRAKARLPVAGLVPAALIPTIAAVLAVTYVDALRAPTGQVMRLLDEDALQIGVACGLAVLLSLRRGTPAPVAMLTSVGFTALIASVPQHDALLAGAIAGVALAEIVDDARRRLAADTIALVTIHDVERADEYVDLLRARNIPASLTGARARGLYRGVGAFVPVTIHVPRDRAEEAASLLRLPPSRPSAPLPPPSAATGG